MKHDFNETEIAALIADLIDEAASNEFIKDELDATSKTFTEAGLLTSGAGFVLTINGREFHVTIKRTK